MAQNSFLVSLSFFFQIWTMFSATKSIWIEDGGKVIFVAVAVNRFFLSFLLQSLRRWLDCNRTVVSSQQKDKKTSFKLVLQLSQLWSVPVSTLLFGNTSWKPTLYKFPTNCISASNLLYISFKPCYISISSLHYTSFKACSIQVAQPAPYQFQSLLYTSCTTCSIPAGNLLCTTVKPVLC